MSTILKPFFLNLTFEQLDKLIAQNGEKSFRAKQIWEWIYTKKVFDPYQMTNLSQRLKEILLSNLEWQLPEVVSRIDSSDGASKLLLKTKDGKLTEAVILRYEERTSLCVSSQVGCKLACSFCQTGKLGFFRHLGADEILAQFVIAQQIVAQENRNVSHVVFMGMGEPLDNYDATLETVKTLVNEDRFNLSKRHVTVSTSGIIPNIYKLADENICSMAISLHACNNTLRTKMMPINQKYPLEELKKALVYYQKQTNLKITIEYILISGLNARVEQAKELAQFLSGLRSKVNLIPFNSHPGTDFSRPSADEIRDFQKYLAQRSIPAPVRYSKGLDASAACGQLAAKNIESLNHIPKRKNVIEHSY